MFTVYICVCIHTRVLPITRRFALVIYAAQRDVFV